MWLIPPIDALGRRVIPDMAQRVVALKAVSFAMVGVINATIDLSVFSFFYYYQGFSIFAANTISWLIAVSGSYVMNSMTTFAAESGRKLRLKAYASFVVAQLAGLFANTTTVFVASYFIPVLMGKVLAIGTSFLVNFSLSHFVVFRHRGQATSY
ncbi:MAG: GtrA family protein [Methylocella sp.]